MSSRLQILVGLLAILGIGCTHEGAVKLRVTLEGFKPRCILLSVGDKNGAVEPKTQTVVSALAGKNPGDTLTVAVIQNAGWSNTLRLTAQSFENANCEGKPVDIQSTEVDVPEGETSEAALTLSAIDADKDGYAQAPKGSDCDDGDLLVNLGQPERCNQKDDNCDGAADEGLNLGQTCMGSEGCPPGRLVCGPSADVVCDSPKKVLLYEDKDHDGYGVSNKVLASCTSPLQNYASRGGDCDDTRPSINPAATEVCDTEDNNCDGTKDEGFDVGASCNPGSSCAGVKACTTGGSVECAFVTSPTMWYPDEDRDTYGKTGAGVQSCVRPTGWISADGDCNDGNRFTYTGATELCDQEDNNCNGPGDEAAACPTGGGSWTDRSQGSEDWRSVAVWGAGGVWIVGGTDRQLLQTPGATMFQSFMGACGGGSVWNAVTVDPNNGTAVFGGNGSKTAYMPLSPFGCNNALSITNTDVRGMFDVVGPGSTFEIHAVGVESGTMGYTKGHAFWFNGSTGGNNTLDMGPLFDVHGVSHEVLFAVGGVDATSIPTPVAGNPLIYRFKPALNDWKSEGVENIAGVVADRLRGVWVVHDSLAYAVGESNSVLKWDGQTWSKLTGPSTGSNLLSVLAFGPASVYVTTDIGRVYRFNGSTWTELFRVVGGKPLLDIAGSRPDDIWVVGEGGKIAHWPK